ncbi:MAG: hypothetical protein C4518_08475 [Desulfobacteraceae bacterium]|nr:MAG: hypothetical protein C4518_08475 [Desulfobacteraceae bacterium]
MPGFFPLLDLQTSFFLILFIKLDLCLIMGTGLPVPIMSPSKGGFGAHSPSLEDINIVKINNNRTIMTSFKII